MARRNQEMQFAHRFGDSKYPHASTFRRDRQQTACFKSFFCHPAGYFRPYSYRTRVKRRINVNQKPKRAPVDNTQQTPSSILGVGRATCSGRAGVYAGFVRLRKFVAFPLPLTLPRIPDAHADVYAVCTCRPGRDLFAVCTEAVGFLWMPWPMSKCAGCDV